MELFNRYSLVIVMVMASHFNMRAQDLNQQITDTKVMIENLADSVSLSDTLVVDSIVKRTSKIRTLLKNWGGLSVGADIAGPVRAYLSDYGQIEGFLKINIKGTYYPVFEAGLGICDLTDDNTNIKYKTTAPFFRIGLDYNFLQNKKQSNKLFIGFRYGFSAFKYDISGPGIVDPIFGGSHPYNIESQSCTSHWAEVVGSVQVQIWKGFHMGWSVRYKAEITSTDNKYCKPYYIPGYGNTIDSSCWGATYNLIWDIRL